MMRFGFAVLVLIFGIVVISSDSADAQQSSTLNQDILPITCDYTTYNIGGQGINDVSCPPFSPSIYQVYARNGRPLIVGVYDAAHTSSLRVFVNGVWYQLGVDPELTVHMSRWFLDLAPLIDPLDEGDYSITVEAIDEDGEAASDSQLFTLESPAESGGLIPGVPNTGVGRVINVSVLFIVVAGIALLIHLASRRLAKIYKKRLK